MVKINDGSMSRDSGMTPLLVALLRSKGYLAHTKIDIKSRDFGYGVTNCGADVTIEIHLESADTLIQMFQTASEQTGINLGRVELSFSRG